MPKTSLNDKDVRNIVAYIHDNDTPKPSWFDEHEGGGSAKDSEGTGSKCIRSNITLFET